METKYNVYKVYSTGRRVKKPTLVIDLNDYELDLNSDDFDVEKIFLDEIRPTLDKKYQNFKVEIIRVDLSQEPKVDKSLEEQKKIEKKRVEFLSKVAAKQLSQFANKKSSISLCMREETEWQWQWCLTEYTTNKYYGPLSSSFGTRTEAEDWINEAIK